MYYRMEVNVNPEAIKIACVGSRTYENKQKIRDMLFTLKLHFKDKLEIISGGAADGADKYVKKYALELGIKYIEFNPAFTVKNLYSAMPDTYYSKPYHVTQLFHRNTLIAKYCDKMIIFRSEGKSNGTDHVMNEALKLNKQVVVISEKSS